MNKMKMIMLSIAIIFTLLLNVNPLLALRELDPATGASLTQNITREKELQQQIVAEKKMIKHPRASQSLPKSLPMPTNKELAAATAQGGVKIPSADALAVGGKNNISVVRKNNKAVESLISNNITHILPGSIVVLLLIAGVIILLKKSYGKKEEGNAMVFAIIVILIVFIVGASLVFLSENENKKSVQSNKQNSILYIADGGIEKAIWELNRDASYSGESNIMLGDGKFTVSVSTPAGLPNQRELVSTGQIGLSRRKIKALIEKVPGSIAVNCALACGGNVNMGGNASVAGGPLTGILVPVGCSVSTGGSSIVTGTPATGNASFPSFEDVFGMTMAQMKSYATTKYTNPGNNPVCAGITWVDGDLKATTTSWHGSGILVVNGDFDIDGGDFTGVIYIVGTFRMTGNARIEGAILSQSMADVTGIFGTADIAYSATAIDQANNVYPFKILTWQEVKN